MKTNENYENQILKTFEFDFETGDFMTVFTLENIIENEAKEGREVYFEPYVTTKGIILNGVGIDASITFDEESCEEDMLDFIQAVRNGQKVYVKPIVGEFSASRTTIKLKFDIYTCEAEPKEDENEYNPFKDKNIIPVKRMTITEEYPTNFYMETTLERIRTKKEMGVDVIYTIQEEDLICYLFDMKKDEKSLFSIANEKVYDYVFKGYTVYAKMKEIDTLMKEYGIVTIKYDILVVE